MGAPCAPCFSTPSHAKPTTIPGLCLPGTSGNSAASDDFTWCARRTRRWSRAAGVAAFLHADFVTAWVARLLLPVGDGVWRAGGGRQGRVRAVVPAGQSLAESSAPFFTRFASQAAVGVFTGNTRAGRGGRPPPSRHSRPDPVVPGRQPIIPWKNGGPAFTVTIFPSCCVSAPPLCRKAPLST